MKKELDYDPNYWFTHTTKDFEDEVLAEKAIGKYMESTTEGTRALYEDLKGIYG